MEQLQRGGRYNPYAAKRSTESSNSKLQEVAANTLLPGNQTSAQEKSQELVTSQGGSSSTIADVGCHVVNKDIETTSPTVGGAIAATGLPQTTVVLGYVYGVYGVFFFPFLFRSILPLFKIVSFF